MTKPPTRPMNHEKGKDYVLGYMCLVDFEHELGAASHGNRIYPTIEDCKEHRKCVHACGMVEVKIEATRILSRSKYSQLGKR